MQGKESRKSSSLFPPFLCVSKVLVYANFTNRSAAEFMQ
jgi:hypothetical protein